MQTFKLFNNIGPSRYLNALYFINAITNRKKMCRRKIFLSVEVTSEKRGKDETKR